MKKIIHPFDEIDKTAHAVFCKIEYTDGKLSISGVVGPYRNGNCWGSCGQIIMSFKEYDDRGYLTLSDVRPAAGWTPDMIKAFMDIWDRWHLNDMKAGCEHQRAMGWDKERIDPDKPSSAYEKFDGHSQTWNLKAWVYPPLGHLTEACPVCGYKFGTAWMKEEVPAEVIEFLESLPDTDRQPAWV